MLTIDEEKALKNKDIELKAAKLARQAALEADRVSKRDACTAPDGAVDVTDAERQFGRGLSSFMVIQKLSKLNGLLSFEVSKYDPSQIGIYLVDGISLNGRRYLMGMEAGESPEFSIRKFKKVKELVPEGPDNQAVWKTHLEFVGEVRGWRTILARLIREKIIGKTAAENEFEVNKGRDSKNWQNLVN